MSFFFYVIQSEIDGSFYRGHAEDLHYRVKKHNNAESRSTKAKRPWRLVYFEKFSTRSEAFKREQFLKSPKGWTDWQKIKERINSERGAAR